MSGAEISSSIWDVCQLDNDLQSAIDELKASSQQSTSSITVTTLSSDTQQGKSDIGGAFHEGGIFVLQSTLTDAEAACRESIDTLDSILNDLSKVSAAYSDVTGRTNNLMTNCENLLEQQSTLHQTVAVLKTTLEPFNDVEDIANTLGIPFDSATVAAARSARPDNDLDLSVNLDPRSPEFQEMLSRLAKSQNFLLKRRHEIKDSDRYIQWLDKLQHRATSLVAKAIRELIDKSSRQCQELYQQQLYKSSSARSTSGEDGPIESAPIYQKFRGLSFRVRELTGVLLNGNVNADIDARYVPSTLPI